MSFFKKLKERLFTLNVDESKSGDKKTSPLKKDDFKKKSKKIDKTKIKKIKTDEKQIRKKLKKQKKIDKYVTGLEKSGFSFASKIKEIQSRHNEIDEHFFDELEEILIMSDISFNLVMEIITEIKKEIRIQNIINPKLISEIVVDKMFTSYANRSLIDTRLNVENKGLNVILIVGVNGSGKTTSIAKIANLLKNEDKKVLIAAADTFRAGAVEQLSLWASMVGVRIVKPVKTGVDPSSVVYDAINKAKAGNYDVLIVDTAGRLQNKVNLMNELAKMNKIIKREISDAPHESLLVLDSTTGQNGISQAKHFKDITDLTGIVLTKMDGTSKGGIVLTIKDELDLSVKLIGFGEKIEDLQEFDLDAFIYGMTKDLMEEK